MRNIKINYQLIDMEEWQRDLLSQMIAEQVSKTRETRDDRNQIISGQVELELIEAVDGT